jgi:peptide/nickel transport system permease protein
MTRQSLRRFAAGSRTRFLIGRIAQSFVVVIGVTIVTFFLLRLVPGSAVQVMLGVHYTPARAKILSHALGLDRSVWSQYVLFIKNLFHGDLGRSIYYQTPVWTLILQRLPVTLWLIVYSTILGVVISVPLAIVSALQKNRATDQGIRLGFMLIFAMPPFWVGLMLTLIFGIDLGLFPVAGYGSGFFGHLSSMFLPALTIALGFAAILVRTLRTSILSALDSPYVETAQAKGLRRGRILNRHVLRNAMIPAISVIGVNLAYLVGGTVIIENVFALPGLGTLLAASITNRDLSVVQGIVLFFGIFVVLVNLATDILYSLLDPRVSY